jgi:hypothetical protein
MVYPQGAPLVKKEWLTAEDLSTGRHARDLDARSEQRIDIPPNKPSIHSLHPSSRKDGRGARDQPSIGRRIFRTLTRFFIAVLIGVGATLGWQSYGDAAREMLVARAPTLAGFLPASATKSPVVAATSPDPMQQLAPLASNLDVVRHSLEQLAAKQEQMAQNIAALQAVEEDVRQKMLSTPPPPAQQPALIPQPKPAQPRAQSSAVQSSSAPRRPPPATSLSR